LFLGLKGEMERKIIKTKANSDDVAQMINGPTTTNNSCPYYFVSFMRKDKTVSFLAREKKGGKFGWRKNTSKPGKWERLCGQEGCYKQNGGNGKCFTHGGGFKCIKDGCNTAVKTKGKPCVAHGNVRKNCIHEGCKAKARIRDLCSLHGGYAICAHPSCEERATTRSPMCTNHTSKKVLDTRRGRDRVYMKKVKDENPSFRTVHTHRTYLYGFLSKEPVRGEKMTEHRKLIGGDRNKVRAHVESLFKDGMTWENYGEWEFDHIIPWTLFDLTKDSHKKVCFHYLNIQPLWASDNRSKKAKLCLEMVSDELATMFIPLGE
jgi:hypothetical protein